ncbi:MAG: trehalose-phosphatase, partial [Planctomycetes bacterium]|nr:trehalose-phosphatase [Planctomycetota bacterium]
PLHVPQRIRLLATLPAEMRSLVAELADRCPVAIVSGRDRKDARSLVQLDNLIYAGSHGFDIEGPGGLTMQQHEATRALPDLDQADRILQDRLQGIPGVRIERKRFAIAVHYREVPNQEDIDRIARAVDGVRHEYPSLRQRGGKKIFELQPDVAWDKGRAVTWLIETLGLDGPEIMVMYIGDDVTDEDAFDVLRRREGGIGVRVGPGDSPTKATYYLRNCDEVREFLKMLLTIVGDAPGAAVGN